MDITIRRAQKKDAPKLVELLHIIARLHHEGRPDFYLDGAKYTELDVMEKLLDKTQIILVAANGDDCVVGYTMSRIIDTKQNGIVAPIRRLYIDDVCVDPSCRKQGVGRKLMEATKQAAVEEKCSVADLNVWAFNEEAVEFYKSCGMKIQRYYMEYVLE